jgi:hypothetical protein
VVTGSAHGDKSGHSTYHAWVNKVDKRFGGGLTLSGSYVFSKLISDTDSYGIDGNARDHYRLYLEKSIGAIDVPHNFKLSYIYDLPFGKGKKYLGGGPASVVLGGWRFAGIHRYASGTPITLGNSVSFPIFNGGNRADVTTLENWVNDPPNPDWRGDTRFFNSPCTFSVCNAAGQPVQPADRLGGAPRFNGHARNRAALTENFPPAKTFAFTEQVRMDFRWEMLNAFNRVRLATGSTNIQDPNFGKVTSQLNDLRRMQFALKLYF